MILKHGIAAVFLALVLSGPVLAADYQAGWEAYERGDFAAALKEFRPLAEQGLAEAQADLAVMYLNGQGVPQDYARAMKGYMPNSTLVVEIAVTLSSWP